MHWIDYEHPLNEKIRVYLRVESILKQIYESAEHMNRVSYPCFFGALFNLLDLLDRTDMRGDLLKDLERHDLQLQQWAQHPEVDPTRLEATHNLIVELQSRLSNESKFANEMRSDRFIASVRQRMGLMGSQCHIDVPELNYWLQQHEDSIKQQAKNWASQLDVLRDALQLELRMLREQGQFEAVTAPNGSFHESPDRVVLIRLKVPADAGIFPMISGNRVRYSIKFMEACTDDRKPYNESIQFQLARCCI